MTIKEQARAMKADSFLAMATTLKTRNLALEAIAKALDDNRTEIIKENQIDLEIAKEEKLAGPLLGRLEFDNKKIDGVITGIHDLIGLPDPIGKKLLEKELDEGLCLVRQSCPIGVIGVIFESRPDALIQISTLCLKSGNCAILKGGHEALHTNRILFRLVHDAAVKAGLPENWLFLAEARSEINELLDCHDYVDLLIPRGSNQFVQYIMNNTKIPVMGHADGICHCYVDQDADLAKAVKVVLDSKTQATSVCNATETLLVHRKILSSFLPMMKEAFDEKKVEIRGTKEIQAVIDCLPASEEDWSTEYLDLIISVKAVEDVDEAIKHINHFGSHHTDAIITENDATAEHFMNLIDSAGVYHNASTRFADGYRYGFGAEVGISTSKLHARGPVGLEGLCTYKYKLYGHGHIVADYATGVKSFHFKEL